MLTLPRSILARCALASGLLLTACDAPEDGDGDSDDETGDAGSTTAGTAEAFEDAVELPLAGEDHVARYPAPKKYWQYKGVGYWAQGDSDRRVVPESDNFCFLTVVAGKFEGLSEWVGVYREFGSWWLGGDSDTQDLLAAVNCVPLYWYGMALTYTGEYFWNQASSGSVDLGPTASRVCFLTTVSGNFNSSLDWVNVYTFNGHWYLGGYGASGDILAGARCVDTPRRVGPVQWTQGQPPQLLADTHYRCGLTSVRGKLEGWGEKVAITVSDDSWYLGGTSYQSGVSGTAYCM